VYNTIEQCTDIIPYVTTLRLCQHDVHVSAVIIKKDNFAIIVSQIVKVSCLSSESRGPG
jgi:hypothetical protein